MASDNHGKVMGTAADDIVVGDAVAVGNDAHLRWYGCMTGTTRFDGWTSCTTIPTSAQLSVTIYVIDRILKQTDVDASARLGQIKEEIDMLYGRIVNNSDLSDELKHLLESKDGC